MSYRDLREFIAQLESLGELKRIAVPVDPRLEMTEICDRVLKREGPALLFERPAGHSMPVLGNLFGTTRRVALAMGRESLADLRELGRTLAYLKEPEPPSGWRDAWDKLPLVRQVLSMAPREVSSAQCQELLRTHATSIVDQTSVVAAPFVDCGIYTGTLREQLCDPAIKLRRFVVYQVEE